MRRHVTGLQLCVGRVGEFFAGMPQCLGFCAGELLHVTQQPRRLIAKLRLTLNGEIVLSDHHFLSRCDDKLHVETKLSI